MIKTELQYFELRQDVLETTIGCLSLTKPANTSEDLTGLKQHDFGEDSQYNIL